LEICQDTKITIPNLVECTQFETVKSYQVLDRRFPVIPVSLYL